MTSVNDFLGFMQQEKQLSSANRPLRLRLAFPDGVSGDMLLPQRVGGTELICGGFEYRVLCLATDAALALKEVIAVPAEIQFVTDRGRIRSLCGIVTEACAGNSDGGVASYQLVLRDAMAIMEKRTNTRIFRNANELDVIEIILGEWRLNNPVLADAFEFEIDSFLAARKHPKRETIMQHNETDAAFLRRLMKRRGIAWFFRAGRAQGSEAGAGTPAHTLVMFDDANSLRQNAAGTVRFHRDDGTEQRDTVTAWGSVRTLQPGSVTRHSWDYRNPLGTQFMTADAPGSADQGRNGNQLAASLDDYQVEMPHAGNDHADHCSLGVLRMARHDYESKCFRGESSVRDLCVGEYITLSGHPEIDRHPQQERDFVITALHVHAQNNLPTALAEKAQRLFDRNRWDFGGARLASASFAGDAGATRSRNEFTAVRRGIEIVPSFDARVDLPVPQLQSAIVVGPKNEEVYCDQLGRVKVRFPGMRSEDHRHASGVGASDTDADSAWVRVASNWAGNGPGSLSQCGTTALPRVGTEALVAFLGGDPDKPIIIGQLFNQQAAPPALSSLGELPGNRYLAGMKSREIHGERANQLRLDDTPGQISAQLASDHGHSELNLGWLTQPRADGDGQPRGEGAELRSDRAVAVRGGEGVLISADARRDATGSHLDREELIGVAMVLQGVAQQLSTLAVTHVSDQEDGPQLARLIDSLKDWANGTNVGASSASAGGGGQRIVAVSAPAGALIGSQENVAIGAQSTIDTLSAGDTRIGAGGNLLMRTARGMSLFAYKLGIKLIAASGNVNIQAQNGDIEITSPNRIKLIAGKGVEIQSPEIKFVAQGTQVNYGGGEISQQSSGAHTIKSSTFDHVVGGNGSPAELKLPKTEVEHDQQVILVDHNTGTPASNKRYRLILEDGQIFDGVTGTDGLTQRFATKLAFCRFEFELLD